MLVNVIAVALIGGLLWAANRYLSLDRTTRRFLNVVVPAVVLLWLCAAAAPRACPEPPAAEAAP